MRTATRLLTGTALGVMAAAWLAAAPALAAGPSDPGGTADQRLDIRPARAVPGDPVTADTAACGTRAAATGDASAVGAGAFRLAPGGSDRTTGRFEVPTSASPGTYSIRAKCAAGKEVSGDLVVTLTTAGDQVNPKGHVKTGVGGALGPDPVQTAAGVAALAVAAAGGTWLLHRRARGDGI
ncbi:hypothetical protein DSC45_13875 [Streptomyces sp. YIM 130001]|uniref:hypothetical protein n=1 Tax=Streptomyces sp. YIM 130001 TaxID=2259644 RepID=UPI000E656883|nr:hypothetical protein [Streptomyces sp. YIM 130001]RII17248.1 hypothetical protein DSC45_13875 [Streptomyces sp. YIM 130001]